MSARREACPVASHGAVLFRTAAGMVGSPAGDTASGSAGAKRVARPAASAALLAVTAAVAVGCASHVVQPEPAPPRDGLCGDEPGVCLLGTPAPLDEGGAALGWQCLGLDGGANVACALPSAAPPLAALEGGLTQPSAAPAAAQSVAGAGPRPAGGAQRGGTRPAARQPRPRGRIGDLLAAKGRRTPAQRKVGSRLLERAAAEALRRSGQPLPQDRELAAGGVSEPGQAEDGRVLVDIRADVTPAVLARIRELGGAVVNSVPRYRAIRALLPLPSRRAARRARRDPDDPHRRRGRDPQGRHVRGRRRPPGGPGAADAPRRRHGRRDRRALQRRPDAARPAGVGRRAGAGDGAAWAGGSRGRGHRDARDRPRPRAGRRPVLRDGVRRRGAVRREHRGAVRGGGPTSSSTTSSISGRLTCRTTSSRRASTRRSPTAASSSPPPATTAT